MRHLFNIHNLYFNSQENTDLQRLRIQRIPLYKWSTLLRRYVVISVSYSDHGECKIQ